MFIIKWGNKDKFPTIQVTVKCFSPLHMLMFSLEETLENRAIAKITKKLSFHEQVTYSIWSKVLAMF